MPDREEGDAAAVSFSSNFSEAAKETSGHLDRGNRHLQKPAGGTKLVFENVDWMYFWPYYI